MMHREAIALIGVASVSDLSPIKTWLPLVKQGMSK